MTYNFNKIEQKYKDKWYEENLCEAQDFSDKPKKYILAELPYPSGYALHAGHMMRYTVPEVYSRYLRMKGHNVMFPMGWDSFGLPAENFAIKTGTHPAETTQKAIKNFKESLVRMGYGFDWSREIDTSSPEYYKWTQWIFLKLWKEGLAEQKEMPVWWSEDLKTVLADEEVLTDKDGNKISERGGHPVDKKLMKQWVLKIPEYAEKLIEGLNEVDYMESVKIGQLNWIGKSEGALVKFGIINGDSLSEKSVEVFTTRPDTIFGVSFIAISPEHPIASELASLATNKEELEGYIKRSRNLSDMEKQTKDKTGVLIKGVSAVHPFSEYDKDIPVFIADYILTGYGTGSIMGVPAHDQRDLEFARKYSLEVIKVIEREDDEKSTEEFVIYTGEGKAVNSAQYTGMNSEEFKTAVIERLEKEDKGGKEVHYKMRDQVFSRQRYWGEPIPLVYTESGNVEPVADPDNMEEVNANLPLLLPEVPDYRPTSDGSSPLSKNQEWVRTVDKEGNPATRETDTMPTWAGSNWYFLRYIDPKNNERFADFEKLKYWLPVDRYFGDSGHTTAHLLYSRFWHKFLYDQGLVPTPEPYHWRMSGGLLLGPDGNKMSKSKGNIVDPMTVVDNYGADATRMYLCFIGPYEDTYPWNENGIKACWRLAKNIYDMQGKVQDGVSDPRIEKAYNKMVKNITGMVESIKMNTSVSELMIFTNELKSAEKIDSDIWKGFIKVLAPFMPFLAENLWQTIQEYGDWKKENSVHLQEWPSYDPKLIKEESIQIPVQVNGKVRDTIEVTSLDDSNSVEQRVRELPKIKEITQEKEIVKIIYIPEKIVSIVLK